ncbi:Bro-N domain-containing protein [Streptomyces sp. NPDC093111]|uniref:Bro-N domain-containing protein n=1 Tax=Streptomyces sp. NPDC093111 TaxID=3154978 RepID=UPI00341A2428
MNANVNADAIDIDDFVFSATGVRLRRLTLADGTHWFPAADVAGALGHTDVRTVLRAHVGQAMQATLGERMISLEGLVQLVAASTTARVAPFTAWIAELVTAVQRHGAYGLEPSSLQSGFVPPPPVLDELVRLEAEELDDRALTRLAEAGDLLAVPVQRVGPDPYAGPALTPQDLLDSWRERNVELSADVHAVAACLAPELVRGGVRYRLEEVARRTGLPSDRVRDCLRMLVERGCIMRHAEGGSGSDGGDGGGLLYLLP